ncbi:thiazolylpeptide-type bacteriocin [Streptomyces sp. NPDC058682]|uniref:thiazolylpeptide-type bacteriocin n=1 Tax=unclassified Streptomyces TaxID=2593676 RepID=UPI0022550002|nr:thiazolylpeptide-type bacteriocin [Streptomyces sp. NBC_01214]MCX4806310.1 thiazolylpeptide-type bacteriocin [Streptomyces sp. NBC_01214]
MDALDIDFEEFSLEEIAIEDVPDTTGLPVMGASSGASCCRASCSCCSSSS